jgi:hypothetical protein
LGGLKGNARLGLDPKPKRIGQGCCFPARKERFEIPSQPAVCRAFRAFGEVLPRFGCQIFGIHLQALL